MKFLNGIYGIDYLTIFLLILSSLFNIWVFTVPLGFICLILSFFRMLSKNHYKRRSENQNFVRIVNKPLGKLGMALPYNSNPITINDFIYAFSLLANKFKNWSKYKITKCPSCGQKLRLPRRKGKIVVTCKRCNNKFDLRT
ncbi:hypothetical protein [Clostridium tertium]|uniref:Zn-finger containing protein n=1 Tax=Clostridium tertium TaxID=1559 RepID=A0A6N3C2Q8_9CLOT